jgi:hypothetical protein
MWVSSALSFEAATHISTKSEAVSSTLILATVDFILVLRWVSEPDPCVSANVDGRVWLLYEKARWLLYVLVPMIGCKC